LIYDTCAQAAGGQMTRADNRKDPLLSHYTVRRLIHSGDLEYKELT